MKLLFLCLLISGHVFSHTDETVAFSKGPKLPRKRFFEIIRIFETEFQELARVKGRKFEIFADYNSDWAQAFARRWETDHILVYGGAASLGGDTEDTFALLLCHETGHLYGGAPWSDEHNELSLEGQADYWSASCFKRILPRLSPREGDRLTDAALALTAFYADNRGIAHPDVTTPDLTVVDRILKTHPEPQCRLDTILSGMRESERPLCWWKP